MATINDLEINVRDGFGKVAEKLNALDGNKIEVTEKGAANGVAELDGNGVVLEAQLPSFVNDVLEGEYIDPTTFNDPSGNAYTPEDGKIYVDTTSTNNKGSWRWSGTQYTKVESGGLVLGETSSTAYRGDRGKIAYDHSQETSGNPHNVTKNDVGLGNVDNTSDLDKPISTLVQEAIDGKLDFFPNHFTGDVDTLPQGFQYVTIGATNVPPWATTDGSVLTMVSESNVHRQLWIGRNGEIGSRGGTGGTTYTEPWTKGYSESDFDITDYVTKTELGTPSFDFAAYVEANTNF